MFRKILRHYFAGQVLTGIIASPQIVAGIHKKAEEDKTDFTTVLANMCYEQADAMIKRSKEKRRTK